MTTIRNMHELQLKQQSLNYKLRHLEDQMKGQSRKTVYAFTSCLKNLAFEMTMKMATSLLFRNKGKTNQKQT